MTYVDDMNAVAEGCDALVVATEWDEFKKLDLDRAKKSLTHPIMFDGRNLFDRAEMERLRLDLQKRRTITIHRYDGQPPRSFSATARLLIHPTARGRRISADFGNFPAANAKPGETFEQCLVREIREELGVEIDSRRIVRRNHARLSGKNRPSEIFHLQIDFAANRSRWAARRSNGFDKAGTGRLRISRRRSQRLLAQNCALTSFPVKLLQ